MRRLLPALVSMVACAAPIRAVPPARPAAPAVRPAEPGLPVLAAADTAAPAVVATACRPLPAEQWARDPMLVIHEATTCRYRITWTGWSPPRDYEYRPDAEGWVSDYFIVGGYHGRVFWNLSTNTVWVRPIDGDHPLDDAGAREVAGWAQATNFPGLDLATVQFNPAPCDANPCGPR